MSTALMPSRRWLPAVTRGNLVLCLVVGYVLFGGMYLGSAAAAVGAPRLLEPTALDLAVPFVASSIWIYLSQFVLLPWALASARNDAARSRAFYSMLLATAFSALVFVLLPTCVPRPTPPTDGLLGLVWKALHSADTPCNGFPSLHVALAALAGALLWQRRRRLLALAWPAFIAASTLTTRQHVVWDIAGGLLLAPLAWMLTPRFVPYDRNPPPNQAPGR